MEEETYYVNVREPSESRRNLLETSREIVLALQKYENFKLSRVKKHNLVDLLRKNFREINDLILRLRKEMPQVKARKRIPEREEKPKALPRIPKKNDLDDLERELSLIEGRLKSLK